MGEAVLEKKIFENGGWRMDDGPWLYYKLTNEPKGSGELKIFFSGTKRLVTLNFGMNHGVVEYYQVCSNDDPGLTMTYFKARSNLIP